MGGGGTCARAIDGAASKDKITASVSKYFIEHKPHMFHPHEVGS
jgi:hypothetical protein